METVGLAEQIGCGGRRKRGGDEAQLPGGALLGELKEVLGLCGWQWGEDLEREDGEEGPEQEGSGLSDVVWPD